MNIEQLNKTIETEIQKDNVLNQQIEALQDYIEFDEMFIDIDQKTENHKLVYDIQIDYRSPKFTQDFLKRKQITDIDFEYNNYNLSIEHLESEEYSLDSKSLTSEIEELQEQIKQLKIDFVDEDDDNNPQKILDDKIQRSYDLREENKLQIQKLKNEIEITLNVMFYDLKSDTEKLINRIYELVEDYNQQKGNGLDFKDIWKSFKNDRVKSSVIKSFFNTFKFKVHAKQIEVRKQNEKIRSLKQTMTAKNMWDWMSIISEINLVKERRSILKEEYQMMKDSLSIVESEIEGLVEQGFEELLFDLYHETQYQEDIKITKTELYKYTLQDYNKIVQKYTL